MSRHTDESSMSGPNRTQQIPESTAARLAACLRALTNLPDDGWICSRELAESIGVDPATVRRDLSLLGTHGVRGVGYVVGTLTRQITSVLGSHRIHPVVLVGTGNLGHALAGYSGLAAHGFEVRVLLDDDPAVIGTEVPVARVDASAKGAATERVVVRDIADAATVLADEVIEIGIIATPVAAAQQAADVLVGCGIGSILNFAPCILDLPPEVHVRKVDVGLQLQLLAFHQTHRGAAAVRPFRRSGS